MKRSAGDTRGGKEERLERRLKRKRVGEGDAGKSLKGLRGGRGGGVTNIFEDEPVKSFRKWIWRIEN